MRKTGGAFAVLLVLAISHCSASAAKWTGLCKPGELVRSDAVGSNNPDVVAKLLQAVRGQESSESTWILRFTSYPMVEVRWETRSKIGALFQYTHVEYEFLDALGDVVMQVTYTDCPLP